MSNLKRNYNRFVFKHRDKGIRRLMFWLCVSNAVVFVLSYFIWPTLPSLLYFNAAAIMHGQVWRLVTYIFTFACGSAFLGSPILGAVISILFYYWVGNLLENTWGTLRFNIFYFVGLLLADLYAILSYLIFKQNYFIDAHYLNLSMFLAVATLIPEQKVYIYMIIPVKMKWLAWLDLAITALSIISGMVFTVQYWGHYTTLASVGNLCSALFPLVSILNYFIFFGKDVRFLFNFQGRRHKKPRQRQNPVRQPQPDCTQKRHSAPQERSYRHKCTVCGRTDTACPDLEFRYCSKCRGYFCYCIDHISNHTHVQ